VTGQRRWLRLVVPYLVVLILFAITGVAYAIDEPDLADPDFLSPTSAADIGASKLADRLRQRGITIERQARTADALVSARRGDAILFITTPDLLHSYYLRMLKLMPSTTTVVLVRPADDTLARGLLPADVFHERWVTEAVAPQCQLPAATTAGRASVRRVQYEGDADQVIDRCYRSALIRTRHHATTLTLVGANEPFRNDRIDEHGNSALSTGLLADGRRVVWLDRHEAEPGPAYLDDPGLDQSPAPASLGSGKPDVDFPIGDPSPPPAAGGAAGGGSSLFDLFPASAWAVVVLAMLAAALAAAARARRLGVPVPEPLPVLVPAAETVTGRGRLYERARDRGTALAVLRTAARERLIRLLDQPPDVDQETLVAVVAAHSGWPATDVATVLEGRDPEGDAELVAEAAALESLIAAVTHIPDRQRNDIDTDREERP
jgi:hypothetical protein